MVGLTRARALRWSRGQVLLGVGVAAVLAGITGCSGAGGGSSTNAGSAGGVQTINVAIVESPQMDDIIKLTPDFEAAHKNIKVRFVKLEQQQLRDQVLKDVATGAGQFDSVMVGPYEIPTWVKNGWIDDLSARAKQAASYDVDDLIKPVRDSLSVNGKLYAVPFYGEASFLMYRKDLFQAAGLVMPTNPTWQEVAGFAHKLNDPAKGMSGICLRGKPGWGDNWATVNTVVNTMGGAWYDKNWNAQLTSPEFVNAVKFYVDLVKTAGEPGAASASYNECANLIGQGRAAMWYDATVAAGNLEDPNSSKVAGKIGYAPAPVEKTKSSGWLWTWALATEASSKHKDATWEFESWATSKAYIKLAGTKLGWSRVPPGSRTSTYDIAEYKKAAAAFAEPTLKSIAATDVTNPGVSPRPYIGIQYVGIPEFQDLGTSTSQQLTAAIAGSQTVEEALKKCQELAQAVGDKHK